MSKRSWLPSGAPRAVVRLIHGMCEHIDRYDYFADRLAQQGYAVFAEDLPGHGKDCPTPGYAPGDMWETSLDTIRNDCAALRQQYPDIPMIVFGHSYGSFLLQRLVPELGADAYILSGSSRQQDAEKLGRLLAIARELPPEAPAHRLAQLTFVAYNGPFEAEGPNAWLSRDRSQVEKYNADPLCGFVSSGAFYQGMYGGLVGLCDAAFPPAAKKATPILVMSGSKDPVGNFGTGVEALAELYRERGYGVTLRLYPDGRHEMLNELDRDRVISHILDFMDQAAKT